MLRPPVDHCAIKARDSVEFEEWIAELLPFCTSASFAVLNNRRLATLELKMPVYFGVWGQTTVLEVMEPRPEKVGNDFTGFEHIELFHPSLNSVADTLEQKKVPFDHQENPGHKAVVLALSPEGHEVKFTDNHLRLMVKKQLESGESTAYVVPSLR